MAKKGSPYNIENILDEMINKEVGRRMVETGIKKRKKDIIAEIAEYTGVGWENINRIKRGIVTPSLPVAIKIAEYFNVKVEDIFKISVDKR